MAGYKETPRQKMIAMMYLVLTALLALNVSKEILDAFLVVNKSMESTNESVTAKIREKYAQFENQYDMNQNKVGPYWERAKNVRKEGQDLINYLDYLKYKLVEVSERKDSLEIMNKYYIDTVINGVHKKVLELRIVPTKDKYDATTTYMMRGTWQWGSIYFVKENECLSRYCSKCYEIAMEFNKNWIDYEYRRGLLITMLMVCPKHGRHITFTVLF